MKLGKLTLSLFAATLVATISFAEIKTIEDESIGLRKDNLYTEDKVVGDQTKYKADPAGTSTKFQRAYENAPPMIPHDVEGMLNITRDNNACIGCHDAAVAESMGATPIPKSHFTNFRPKTKVDKNGAMIVEGQVIANTSDIKTVSHKNDSLEGARLNCTQCHAPQSTATEAPANNFAPEFRSEGLNGKSNLIDVINDGVK